MTKSYPASLAWNNELAAAAYNLMEAARTLPYIPTTAGLCYVYSYCNTRVANFGEILYVSQVLRGI